MYYIRKYSPIKKTSIVKRITKRFKSSSRGQQATTQSVPTSQSTVATKTDPTRKMSVSNVLVIGASRGVGLQIVAEYVNLLPLHFRRYSWLIDYSSPNTLRLLSMLPHEMSLRLLSLQNLQVPVTAVSRSSLSSLIAWIPTRSQQLRLARPPALLIMLSIMPVFFPDGETFSRLESKA